MKKKRKIVSLTITNKCNLNCIYCYENNKNNKKMSFETAIRIIENEFGNNADYEKLEIQFHGGEPFIEFDLIKKVCEYCWENFKEQDYIFYLTTNGTLLNDEIKLWLTENKTKIICGLSLDGDKISQNINRSGSFHLIDIEFFKKMWPNQGIKMTISDKTIANLFLDISFMHSLNMKFSCNFAYGIDWGKKDFLEILEKELDKLVNFYVTNKDLEPCSILNYNIANILEKQTKLHCGSYNFMSAYDTKGNKYPCHMFIDNVINKEFDLNTINNQLSNYKGISNKKCINCYLDNICPICHGNSFIKYGDISKRDESYCNLIKLTVLATTKLMFGKIKKYGIESCNYGLKTLNALLLIQKNININLIE